MFPSAEIGDSVICPICGKKFTRTPEHAYIKNGGFTCSWKCFLGKVSIENVENMEKVGNVNRKVLSNPVDGNSIDTDDHSRRSNTKNDKHEFVCVDLFGSCSVGDKLPDADTVCKKTKRKNHKK